jgi:hypothetical protein
MKYPQRQLMHDYNIDERKHDDDEGSKVMRCAEAGLMI